MTDTDAVLCDFDAGEEVFTFNFTAQGDEFWRAKDFMMDAIPVRERAWNPNDHLWTVKRTQENEDALRKIFANGECCILRSGI